MTKYNKGDRVTVAGTIVSRMGSHGVGVKIDGYSDEITLLNSRIVTHTPREIKVGDRVSSLNGQRFYTVKAIEDNAFFLKAESSGDYMVGSAGYLKLAS